MSKVVFLRRYWSEFSAVFAPFGGQTVMFGFVILDVGNVLMVVEIGEPFHSENDMLMRIEDVVNPAIYVS